LGEVSEAEPRTEGVVPTNEARLSLQPERSHSHPGGHWARRFLLQEDKACPLLLVVP